MIQNILSVTRKSLSQKIELTGSFSSGAFRITAFLSVLGLIIGISAAFFITRNLVRSLNELKLATSKFSERKFDFVPDLKSGDEFGSQASD